MSNSHLTDEQGTAILLYCKDLLDAMGIGQYRITLADDPCEDGCDATITVEFGYLNCTLAIGLDWHELSRHRQAEALTHECMHILLEPFQSYHNILSETGLLGDVMLKTLDEILRQRLELTCDLLAFWAMRELDVEGDWKRARKAAKKGEVKVISTLR